MDAEVKEIHESFELNIERVRNLVKIYESVTGSGSGRRPPEETDVLRAAVVFLHATLEELLRELERWKLPQASAEKLAEIPLKGKTGKIWLSELLPFRGKSVQEVIEESIDAKLDESSYNNLGDVSKVLDLVGLGREPAVEKAKVNLNDGILRRHKIVHA